MSRGPITLYKKSPFDDPFGEWHEIWCQRLPDGAKVGNRHGWWDDQRKEPHYNVPVYSEIFQTESDADLAFDKRLAEIVAQGFTFKLGTFYDPMTGMWHPVRIP